MGKVSFGMEGGYFKQGRMLFIPCSGVEKPGYLCMDGFGVPIWYQEKQGGIREYCFGHRSVHWNALGWDTLISYFNRTSSAEAMVQEIHISFETLLGDSVDCYVFYNLKDAVYYIRPGSLSVRTEDMPLYCVPQGKLAKLALML